MVGWWFVCGGGVWVVGGWWWVEGGGWWRVVAGGGWWMDVSDGGLSMVRKLNNKESNTLKKLGIM